MANKRDELKFLVKMMAKAKQPERAIQTIHSTSRWLHGRSSETFWDLVQDSREWDENDSRRAQVQGYIPHEHPPSQYTLPLEIRVLLGLSWLQINNPTEAMVSLLRCQSDLDPIPISRERKRIRVL